MTRPAIVRLCRMQAPQESALSIMKVIGWMAVASACASCGGSPLASLGGPTYVVTNAGNSAVFSDPNNTLPTPSGAPSFLVTTNWQDADPNVTTSSPGLNFVAAGNPNLCMDIGGGNSSPNTLIQTWVCNGYDPAQAWFIYKGQLHTQAGLCLDTVSDDVTQASQVVTQPCDSTLTRAGQLWTFSGGLLQITNSSRCLSLNATSEGTVPQLADCNFHNVRQNWIGARSDGSHMRGVAISTAIANSACLYVAESTLAGTPLTLHACDFGVMEQFVLEGTHLRILGKCVQAAPVLGSSLTIEECSNDISQQWVWSNGTLQLAADTTKCASLINSNAADNSPVQVQACSGAVSQQWAVGTSGY